MKIIDTRGTLCPIPIIMAKKALRESSPDEKLNILTDNQTSFENLMTFFRENNIQAQPTKEKDYFSIIISVSGFQPQSSSSNNLKLETRNLKLLTGTVIVIKSKMMGDGDELLGIMLMEAYINTLNESDTYPETIIFYNQGVHLVADDSKVIKSLKALEEKGVKIISCGTCIDYYELKDKISTGTITNMLTISETLLKAQKVIYP
jgi:selenium metabolism protein YedF